MRRDRPSRITRARGLVIARRASRTFSLRISCTIEIDTDKGGEGEQHDSAHQVAEGGVDRPARQQQAEHRLAQYLQGNLPEATRTGGGKFIRAIGREAPPGLLLREAGGGRCHDGPVRGRKSVGTALVIIPIACTRLSLADWSA